MKYFEIDTYALVGVHFEIAVGPYLKNPALRKNFFANGAAIIAATGKENKRERD